MLCGNTEEIQFEPGVRYSKPCAWSIDFIVSVLFRPPVGKAFILTLAVRIAISCSFAYILMATACSLKEFPFFPSRYIIFWIVVTGWPENPSIAEGKNEWKLIYTPSRNFTLCCFSFSLTLSLLESKEGSASPSYCYITIRLPGRV
jgi:hypothetical protein